MTPNDIAQKIREALDAERWGDWDIDAIGPTKPEESDVVVFANNDTTGEDLEFRISINLEG